MSQNIDDIFERGQADLGEFFKFQNVGDRIAGTFIDLLQGVDGYGNDQYVVVLRRDGVNHRVSVRKSHTILVDRLRPVRFGQIIGFSFDEERPSAKGANTKIINLKQDPTMIDEAWIQTKVASEAKYGKSADAALTPNFDGLVEAPTAPAPAAPAAIANAVPVAPSVPQAPAVQATASPVSPELLTTVKTLIVNKGILTDAATEADVVAKVQEISGLPFTAENGPAIINKIATAGF